MKMPNNYDQIKTGGFTPIALGGHHLIIKHVKEDQSKSGKPMLVVSFDFAPNDKQPEYFKHEFDADTRDGKKWPIRGRKYIMVEDSKGNCSRDFKSFTTCVEKSNPGFAIKWVDNFAPQFKEKRLGGVFGEVESEYNGKVSMRPELRWFCTDSEVDGASVPEPKRLKTRASGIGTTADGFMSIPDGTDDDTLPFD